MSSPWDIIIAILGSNALFAFITSLLQHHWSKKDIITQMLVALCRDRITCLGEKYISSGSVTERELTILMDIYTPYHKAGGNDVASKIIDDVKRLPIKTSD
ncbi:MAG: hypothetical protein PUF17_04750 [Lactimicrobium massiliense]|nr:hypothetical protein [Lactimicrobium massiliense]MDD6560264.1 hypothetical protein [Lactimicrobium massiliense]